MPVIVEPDDKVVSSLLSVMPGGTHAVGSTERLRAWLTSHFDEYVVVLGPNLAFDDAIALCEELRIARPTISVVLVCETLTTEILAAAIKSGARDAIPASDLGGVSAALDRAHQLYVALRGPPVLVTSGKIVTVFSPKGGVGKTTVAVNLALALTERGARRVCLVDLDLAFGDVAITMQLFPTHSIEQAIGSETSMDAEMLDGLLTRHHDSLMVLAAPPHPDVRDRITPTLVSAILRNLKESFDFVVVDTAPAFDEQVLTALDETDECVIVATLDVPALKNVKVALETLEALNIARDHRHLLLNRADDAVGIGADRVEGLLGMGVSVQVSTSIDVAAATNAGTPIIVNKPEHQLSVAIRALATELAGEPVAPTSYPTDQTAATDTEKSGRRQWRRR